MVLHNDLTVARVLSGQQDIDTKLSVCALIQQHLQLVLWFYSVGLLPERAGAQATC